MRATATSLDETVWTQRGALGDELVSRFCRCRGAVVAAIVAVEGVLERIVLTTNEGRACDDEYIALAQAWTGTERGPARFNRNHSGGHRCDDSRDHDVGGA
jgi:hypothetical protein